MPKVFQAAADVEPPAYQRPGHRRQSLRPPPGRRWHSARHATRGRPGAARGGGDLGRPGGVVVPRPLRVARGRARVDPAAGLAGPDEVPLPEAVTADRATAGNVRREVAAWRAGPAHPRRQCRRALRRRARAADQRRRRDRAAGGLRRTGLAQPAGAGDRRGRGAPGHRLRPERPGLGDAATAVLLLRRVPGDPAGGDPVRRAPGRRRAGRAGGDAAARVVGVVRVEAAGLRAGRGGDADDPLLQGLPRLSRQPGAGRRTTAGPSGSRGCRPRSRRWSASSRPSTANSRTRRWAGRGASRCRSTGVRASWRHRSAVRSAGSRTWRSSSTGRRRCWCAGRQATWWASPARTPT